MILQTLNQLYDRLASDPEYGIAPPGYSSQKISFAVVLSAEGKLLDIQDIREEQGKRRIARQMRVPGQSKPSGSGLNPCFLWDRGDYIFGYSEDADKKERALRACEAFRDRHLSLEREIADPAFSALCRFLESWHAEEACRYPQLGELASGFGVFQIVGETCYLHEKPTIRRWWEAQQADTGTHRETLMCLVTGRIAQPARLHEPKIKGVKGAQSSGAVLVSFNCDAFQSYGKGQSLNAPVSEDVAFRYCTTLNSLLSGPQSNKHRLTLCDKTVNDKDKKDKTVNDTTVVFWTEKPTITEGWLSELLDGNLEQEAQDSAALEQARLLLNAVRKGGGELRSLGDDPQTPVHFLGLAPNAARLSVRFWFTGSLAQLFDRLKAHHDAMEMVRQCGPHIKNPEPEFPPVWMLLRETARETKDIPPLLAGSLMRAILMGTAYPDGLAHAIIRRIRADRNINYLRAAMLKAWLTRKANRHGEIPVSLDIQRKDPAYLLGRLFAVLEKTQEDAQPGINATIRDSFYSAASATPSVAFPRLLRTYQHHLAKLVPGKRVNREKLVQDIMEGLETIPSHLNLEDQAQFAIGYYHQRKALFTKSETEDNKEQPQ